ncbi:MAG: S41 family peptidase [bacterium]|nr:S41 family peptidase [bacterium]
MRTIIAIMSVVMMVTLGSAVAEDNLTEETIRFFRKTSDLEQAEIDRCSEILRSSLSTGTIGLTQVRMRVEGCFNDFDGFVTLSPFKPVSNAANQRRVNGPSIRTHVVDTTLVIRLAYFLSDSGDKLKERLASLSAAQIDEIRDVVIDLVSDDGGNILGQRDVLKVFAPSEGARFMDVGPSRCEDLKEYYTAPARGVLADKRYSFLVNEDTASASEWMIAQMKFLWYPDPEQTTVVGVGAGHTFGKTLVQSNDPNLKMRVTCGRWTIPGHPIQGVGIQADRVIPVESYDDDEGRIVQTLRPILQGATEGKK